MRTLERFTSDDEGEEDDDIDDGLASDLEALRKVCLRTGNDTDNCGGGDGGDGDSPSTSGRVFDSDSDDDDLEVLRCIQQRFMKSEEALSPKPLCAIYPDSDDDDDGEDDLEKLISLQRRFAEYDCNKKLEEEQTSIVTSEAKVPDEPLVGKTNDFRVVEDYEDTANTANLLSDSMEMQPAGSVHESASCQSSTVAVKYSRSPEAFQLIFGAVKKNRSMQNLIQTKMSEIEARLKENNELRDRLKKLKDFQVLCRQNTGRSLAQGKDPRIQLISAQSTLSSKHSKGKNAKLSPICSGPVENSHVPNYRAALMKFPILERRKWEKSEDKKLEEGIRQKCQEMLFIEATNTFRSCSGHDGDSDELDRRIKAVSDLEITPEIMKQFLPKVDWNELASRNLEGRSGPECQARWLNSACPLINNSRWTREEDKCLLKYIQSMGYHSWSEIASLLGTNRTPFQCLERFERSLNPRVLKSQWTKEEDAQLKAAVRKFGESDWQSVAATLRGRTGTQCSNRWLKSLRVYGKGPWKAEEDKRLKLAVMFFGPKDWKKVASFVPGRKDVQCRERWHNACSPSLNRGAWTEEEDSLLKAAVDEHGHSWSKVSHHVPGRTDNDCMRRWRVLFREEVPLLKETRKIRKAAFINNFVDREEERPALVVEDFITTPLLGLLPESVKMIQSRKSKRKPSNTGKMIRSKRTVKQAQNRNAGKKTRPKKTVKGGQGSSDAGVAESCGGNNAVERKRIQPKRTVKTVKRVQVSLHKDNGSAESCGGNTAVERDRIVYHRRGKTNHAERLPREQSPDSICSPLRTKNSKVLLVYTRRKKGLIGDQGKEANSSSTEKDVEAPSFNEITWTKRINAPRPHRQEKVQEIQAEENVAFKKRKLEDISTLASSRTDDVLAMSDSEATISAELQCRETSSHMTINSRRVPDNGGFDFDDEDDDDNVPLSRLISINSRMGNQDHDSGFDDFDDNDPLSGWISVISSKRQTIQRKSPSNQNHDDSRIDDGDIPRERSRKRKRTDTEKMDTCESEVTS
ncbi:Myb-like protein L [Linum perenne]